MEQPERMIRDEGGKWGEDDGTDHQVRQNVGRSTAVNIDQGEGGPLAGDVWCARVPQNGRWKSR